MLTNKELAAAIALYHHGIIPAPIPEVLLLKADLPPFVDSVLAISKHIYRVWIAVSSEYRHKLKEIFSILSKGKPPDAAMTTKVSIRDEEMSQELFDLVKPKAQKIFSDLSTKAVDFHLLGTKIKGPEDLKQRIDILLSARSADQIAEFLSKYPDRFIHPEIQRLVRLSEKAYRDGILGGSVVDEIQGRLFNVTEGTFCQNYMTQLSNVHVARIWSGSGIAMC